MGLIDAPDQAANLARDMVYDLERYHESGMGSVEITLKAVREARAAFCARVAPNLHPAFETALSCSRLVTEVEGAALAPPGEPVGSGRPPSSRIPLQGRGKLLTSLFMFAFFATVITIAIYRESNRVVLARIPLAQTVASGETPLLVAGPADLKIAVSADSVRWSGQACFDVDAQALKGDAVVARMSCCAWWPRRRGGVGHAFPIYSHKSQCTLKVPAGGMDRLRVSTRLNDKGTARFEGLEIRAEQ